MKKAITILILIAVIAFGAAALIACEKPTDSTGEITFEGASVASVSIPYSEDLEAMLNISLPADVTGITVSFSVKGANGEFGEWSQEAPKQLAVGRTYVKVRLTKEGYAEKIFGDDGNLYIEITAADFANASAITIANQTVDFDNTAKTAPYSFTVPSGAALSFSVDNKATWSAVQPSFTDAGQYTVFYKVEKANYNTVQGSYTVTIGDPVLEFESGSEIAIKVMPTKTDYAPGEAIDLTGLVVWATFPDSFGEGVFFVLPASRYETDAAEADMSVSGPITITVKGLETDGSESELTASFIIFVDYLFKGTTWYDSEDPADYRRISLLDNENAIYYYDSDENSPAEALAATYTTRYDADNSVYEIAISYTLGEDDNRTEYFYYDAESGEMLYDDNQLSLVRDTDVVISVKLYFTEDDIIYFDIVAANGLIPEATLEILAIYGELYFTDEIDEDELVPSDYQFTEWVLIYCMFDQQDYTGAPFIGYFESENDLIYISATSFSAYNSGRMLYEAVEDGGTWTITFGLHLGVGLLSLIYDTSSGEMIAYVDGEAVSTYTRVSAELFAIVTLATEDETLREYSGSFYKIEKGTAFPAFKYQNGSLISFVFVDYSGEPITEDITLYIEAVDYFDAGSDDVYGTFERNFKFNFDAMLVTVKEGLTVIGGYAFEITSFVDGILSITSDEGSFSGCLEEDHHDMCFVIESGLLAGVYDRNSKDFYAGMPFIEVTFKDSDSSITLDPYGGFGAYFTDQYLGGRFVVTVIDGNTYSLEFTDYYDKSYLGYYDGDARTLVFGSYTLEAPPIYLGQYSYQDKLVTIYEDGQVYAPEHDGEIVGVNTVDGVTTITIKPWGSEAETVTITYDHATDTVTCGGNKYTRCTAQYADMPFVYRTFKNDTVEITIDNNGKVHLNGNMIGEITDLDETELTFTVVYFDEGTPDAYGSYDEAADALTIGGTVYIYD